MSLKKNSILIAALILGTFAQASEPGSGSYAKDCANPKGGYSLFINKDGSATVETDKALYKNVLTSYSYFGNNTPNNFLIAIMFDAKNSPLPGYKGDDGRLEIWKDGKSYYLLENGQKDKKLQLCKKNP